jgi:uncharacterized protein YndB with AHSA1/START domain
MQFTKTVTIQRPIDEVFAYLSDAENDAKWRTNVKEIKRVSGGERSGVGTIYRQEVKGPFGTGFPADLRYTEFEPNRRLAFETIKGAVRPSAVLELAPLSTTATEVRFTMTWVPEGGIKVAAPLIGRMLQRGINESYENLTRVLAPG